MLHDATGAVAELVDAVEELLTLKKRKIEVSELRRLFGNRCDGEAPPPESLCCDPDRELRRFGPDCVDVTGDDRLDVLHSRSDCMRGDMQISFVKSPCCCSWWAALPVLPFSLSFSWLLMEDINFCFRIFVNQSTFSFSLRFGD